jgi:hypothetical protein
MIDGPPPVDYPDSLSLRRFRRNRAVHCSPFRRVSGATAAVVVALCVAALAMTRDHLTPPFYWVSTGPVIVAPAHADPAMVAMKDPTVVRFGGLWHVFATTVDPRGHWGMVYMNFADWADAATAAVHRMDANPGFAGYHCAPQVFFFKPQGLWYLICQSPQPTYSTTTDISDPLSWSAPRSFFPRQPKTVVEGWIDFWVICDSEHAYLFFTDDHGRFYRSRTSLAAFPGGFDDPVVVMHERDPADLFEGSCTYRVKGTGQYLTLVECAGPGWRRYYRSFVADRLDGDWKPLAATWEDPFAGITHVRFADGVEPWTRDISHGELLRDGYDQSMTIDPADLVLLYQGVRPELARGKAYHELPYELGLLRPDPDAAAKGGG